MAKSKIDYIIKVKYVEKYLRGEQSLSSLARELNVSKGTFSEWVRKYKMDGADALRGIYKVKYHPEEIKIRAVKDYLSGNFSMAYVCNNYKISHPSHLESWIMKYNHSINKSHRKRRNKTMIEGRKTTYDERIEIVAFCIKNNDNYKLTSNKYKVSYQQVYAWVNKYKKDGYEGLVDNRGKAKKIEEMSDQDLLKEQIRLLKEENKKLDMENKFLKKLKQIEGRR